ncbi:MAG: HAD family hydrolase [Firmicutes bacterium]|nr:HAD family hydrolase [Bacillota bacterium]
MMNTMVNSKGETPRGRRYDALLIDLDGTLLDLDLDKFIPAYMQSLAKYFSHHLPKEKFAFHLLSATENTIGSKDHSLTNEAAFFADFCRRLEVERREIDPLIKEFYEKDFPRLSSWGAPRPHAPDVLETAQQRDLKLVLATQPIFPRVAIVERLAWGGLSAEPFDLITTMENMHYCKPHQEYYLEISRMIAVPPERCLMAGNNTQDDICAAQAGMGTFLVEGNIIDHGEDIPPIDYRGTLEELAAFIDEEL